MMANYKHVIDLAYKEILKRPADPGGLESWNVQLNSGMTEAEFRQKLLTSDEYKTNFPNGGTPDPPDPPNPPTEGIISFSLNPSDKRCFLLNGKSYTIASHGNIVPAIPGHDWRGDIRLQVQNGESYARLWHILAGSTIEWPWIKVGQKWDLSKFNSVYWNLMTEILTEANKAGIVVEPHIFDRACGGSQQDYKAYPWHPDNNVNNVELPINGPGFPQFYEANLGSNLFQLQLAYVVKWAETCKSFPGTILEIENEKREGNNSGWVKQWAKAIKNANPKQLVSHSDIDLSHVEICYFISEIDVVNPHFGDEGNDPRNLHSYLAAHWKLGKAINIDEFANRLGNAVLLKEMCETITRNGGHFHIEDSLASADGYGAAKFCRNLAQSQNPPFCDIGPQGPAPPCPKEGQRGWSMLYINDQNNKRLFTGNSACEKASREGKIKPGYNIAFDSTALVAIQNPVPEGCGTCVENPTIWSHTLGGKDQQDGPCGFIIWPSHSGTVTAKPTNGPGKAVTKTIKVVP